MASGEERVISQYNVDGPNEAANANFPAEELITPRVTAETFLQDQARQVQEHSLAHGLNLDGLPNFPALQNASRTSEFVHAHIVGGTAGTPSHPLTRQQVEAVEIACRYDDMVYFINLLISICRTWSHKKEGEEIGEELLIEAISRPSGSWKPVHRCSRDPSRRAHEYRYRLIESFEKIQYREHQFTAAELILKYGWRWQRAFEEAIFAEARSHHRAHTEMRTRGGGAVVTGFFDMGRPLHPLFHSLEDDERDPELQRALAESLGHAAAPIIHDHEGGSPGGG